MKKQRDKQLSEEINFIDENVDINDIDINPIIYGYTIKKLLICSTKIEMESFLKMIS